MANFKRKEEIKKLISFIGNGKINIVAGLRRSGKTYLLTKLFKDELIKQNMFNEDDFGILQLDSVNKSIRNEERIGDFFKELKLTEGRNTGIPNTIAALKENGSQYPIFEMDQDRRFISVILKINDAFLEEDNKQIITNKRL